MLVAPALLHRQLATSASALKNGGGSGSSAKHFVTICVLPIPCGVSPAWFSCRRARHRGRRFFRAFAEAGLQPSPSGYRPFEASIFPCAGGQPNAHAIDFRSHEVEVRHASRKFAFGSENKTRPSQANLKPRRPTARNSRLAETSVTTITVTGAAALHSRGHTFAFTGDFGNAIFFGWRVRAALGISNPVNAGAARRQRAA